jgi:hypothetical protein
MFGAAVFVSGVRVCVCTAPARGLQIQSAARFHFDRPDRASDTFFLLTT